MLGDIERANAKSSSPGMGAIISMVNSGCRSSASASSIAGCTPDGFVGDDMYEGPPQGGLKNTTSISRPLFEDRKPGSEEDEEVLLAYRDEANERKSPSMNSIRSWTPYMTALCRASANRTGELSIAMTGMKQL